MKTVVQLLQLSLCLIISFITAARETRRRSAGKETSKGHECSGDAEQRVNTSEQEERFFLPLGSEEAP